jgi:hypothetical protein
MPETNARTAALRRAAGDLIRSPIPDDDAVDVIGEVAAVVKDLQALMRSLKVELAPAATGTDYVATESRSAKRSYNTQGILMATARTLDMSPFDALKALMDADAVRLTWRWTELQAAAVEYDIPMTIVRHEIEDGDPDASVGEVWTSTTSVGVKHADT